jgi:hypothetical protein
MDFAGVPIQTWHSLVVEEHSGVVVFVIVSLVVRVLTDILARGRMPSPGVQGIRQGSDIISYGGSFFAVIFLILSAMTGYLIQPYSTLVASPILINKALTALGALFFWFAFFFVRYRFGPGLWSKRGLYILQLVTAFLGLVFTTLAGSIGAELSLGNSVLDPVYQALGFSWRTFVLQPLEIEVTSVLLIIGVVLVLVLPSRKPKHHSEAAPANTGGRPAAVAEPQLISGSNAQTLLSNSLSTINDTRWLPQGEGDARDSARS